MHQSCIGLSRHCVGCINLRMDRTLRPLRTWSEYTPRYHSIMWCQPTPCRAGKLCGGYVLCLHHPFTARHFRSPGVHTKEGGSDFILHPQKNNPLQRTDMANYTKTHHLTTLRLGYDRTDQAYTQPCTTLPKSFKDKYLRSRPTRSNSTIPCMSQYTTSVMIEALITDHIAIHI